MAKEINVEKLLGDAEAKSKIEGLSFEDGMKTLEGLVTSVESGSLALEKAVQSYELGAHLVDHLRKLLSGAEQKLQLLEKRDGRAVVAKG